MTGAARCPHLPPCPGCPRWGEHGLATSRLAALRDLARRHGLGGPTVVTSAPLGWRRRARLAVRGRPRTPKVGLYREDSHQIVDIPDCLVHHPLVNRAAAAVKEAVKLTGVAPFVEKSHRGVLRYLQAVVERASDRVELTLVAASAGEDAVLPLVETIEQRLGDSLHGLWWNGQRGRGNRILGDDWSRLRGAALVHETIGGADVLFHPGAFGQANLDVADRIVELVHGWIEDGARVVEYHAGCGAIGLGLLRRAGDVHLNEVSPWALESLEAGLSLRPAAERARARLAPGAAADHTHLIEPAAVVIVDPPRGGLEPELVQALAGAPPRRLIQVACGFEAFLREAETFAAGRLELTGLHAFELVPFTDHVEVVARWDRA